MIKTAVLLTVFNRREVTLNGMRTLYTAIDYLQKERPHDSYQFDIYMTDDGSTDMTAETVKKVFPEIRIIQGDGGLYWSGGMRKAWETAIASTIDYDYYLLYNDDAYLYDDALITMYNSEQYCNDTAIISGAFCDREGKVSYGGRDRSKKLIEPDGKLTSAFLMNGNLVLIPKNIFYKIGTIDKAFKHGAGDWDYGLRALKAGFELFVAFKYVGTTNRHDVNVANFENSNYSLFKRIKMLYSGKNNPRCDFIFYYRHFGLIHALRSFIAKHIYAFFPNYKKESRIQKYSL